MSASVTMTAPAKPAGPEWPWHPCGKCWGQRRIFELGGVMVDTETGYRQRVYHSKVCDACFGTGEVPVSFDV